MCILSLPLLHCSLKSKRSRLEDDLGRFINRSLRYILNSRSGYFETGVIDGTTYFQNHIYFIFFLDYNFPLRCDSS